MMSITKNLLVLSLLAVPMSVGCDDGSDSTLVTGSESEFEELQAQMEAKDRRFGEAMSDAYKSDPVRDKKKKK